jgi:hypothetical protein
MTSGRASKPKTEEPEPTPTPLEIEEVEGAKKKVKMKKRGRLETILSTRMMKRTEPSILKNRLGE